MRAALSWTGGLLPFHALEPHLEKLIPTRPVARKFSDLEPPSGLVQFDREANLPGALIAEPPDQILVRYRDVGVDFPSRSPSQHPKPLRLAVIPDDPESVVNHYLFVSARRFGLAQSFKRQNRAFGFALN